jgi:hypothetical protein
MEKKGSICGLVTGPKNGIQELLEMLFYNTPHAGSLPLQRRK